MLVRNIVKHHPPTKSSFANSKQRLTISNHEISETPKMIVSNGNAKT